MLDLGSSARKQLKHVHPVDHAHASLGLRTSFTSEKRANMDPILIYGAATALDKIRQQSTSVTDPSRDAHPTPTAIVAAVRRHDLAPVRGPARAWNEGEHRYTIGAGHLIRGERRVPEGRARRNALRPRSHIGPRLAAS